MKVIRGIIIAEWMSFRVANEKFTSNDYGSTRLETARKLLDQYIGLEIEDIATMQVIPAGNECEVRLRAR